MRDWEIEIHIHRDCTPQWAEWEAWVDEGIGTSDLQWFGRGTAPTAASCFDAAEKCLRELEEGVPS